MIKIEIDNLDAFKCIDINDDTLFIIQKDIDDIALLYNIANSIIESTDKKITFSYKVLTTQHKVELLKLALTDNNCINYTLILNIINLLKTYNTLSDEFFENDIVMFNDIVEFLNCKIALKEQSILFCNELTKWYISLFFSVHKLEMTYLDNSKTMPKIFDIIIRSMDFLTLSGICSKAVKLDINDLVIVNNAYTYINDLTQKNNTVLMLYEKCSML